MSATARLGKTDNKVVSWDRDTGSPYSPNYTAFPPLQGTPHKVSAKQGHAANQLAAAKRKAVETAAKLQAFCGASKSTQHTFPCQDPDKPSDKISLPGNPASALDNIPAAHGLLAPVLFLKPPPRQMWGKWRVHWPSILFPYKVPTSHLTVLWSLTIPPLFRPALQPSIDCLFLLVRVCGWKCLPCNVTRSRWIGPLPFWMEPPPLQKGAPF